MKAFISVDMEGLPHIVSGEHLAPGRKLYDEARSIMTECVLAMADQLHKSGADRVVVADGHGSKVNLQADKMPNYVSVVRGNPRSISMVAGGRDSDMALFLGYHSKPGTPNAIFDHVINGSVLKTVKLNGEEASEFYINAATLGEQGVPIVLVSGDNTLLDGDVSKFAPWAVRVRLKESLGHYSSISPSMPECLDGIRRGVREAIEGFSIPGKMELLKLKTPIDLEVYFTSTIYAQMACHLPESETIGGTGIRYRAKSMEEAYRVTQLLTFVAEGVRFSVM
jgi:D-amino peptidase